MKKEDILKKIRYVQRKGGTGSATWKALGEKRLPTSTQADIMSKKRIPLDVDPEIRRLVIRLNQEGYKTYGSCAGHRDRGYIVFKRLSDKSRNIVRSKMINYGLKNIRMYERDGLYTIATFNPIGRTLSGRR